MTRIAASSVGDGTVVRGAGRVGEPRGTSGTSAAEFLTVEEAAAMVKVPCSTIYEWVRQGRLPCYRLGPRAIRFTPDLLRRFAEENFDRGRGS